MVGRAFSDHNPVRLEDEFKPLEIAFKKVQKQEKGVLLGSVVGERVWSG